MDEEKQVPLEEQQSASSNDQSTDPVNPLPDTSQEENSEEKVDDGTNAAPEMPPAT